MLGTASVTSKSRASRWVLVEEASSTNANDISDETSSAEGTEPLERHTKFFFDNTLVAIQVERTLFNVHKYQLTKSEVFSDMFKMPRPQNNKPEEGSSPEYPIVLKGITSADFAALLTVLYASHFSSDQPAPEASLVITAFRLAYMFNFSELRTFLLPLAEKNLGDVEKVVFAREFDIKEWLAPAHSRLCQREKPLNNEEARKLGVDSVLVISRMREQHRANKQASSNTLYNFYCNVCAGHTQVNGRYTCVGCNGTASLQCTGPGRYGQAAASTTDKTAIEAGMKKWVENGCILKD
ncbi:unnamed protein product [Rhizoctonia solani]|uniref:BTB domain-containing protein n=3 Tax=Rhizoctonia solani TaxID=456999 RepID=A0A8H3CV65_9AGAM|nr:BTB/POZ domain protein [Rhizoctonia solani AG-3 Rhs1AP]KEP48480.1 BTB/POZ domain protein [Rhizoctonia solani 123E]CAE6500657.1 unnamed protein product [Rhizoctonia solani]